MVGTRTKEEAAVTTAASEIDIARQRLQRRRPFSFSSSASSSSSAEDCEAEDALGERLRLR